MKLNRLAFACTLLSLACGTNEPTAVTGDEDTDTVDPTDGSATSAAVDETQGPDETAAEQPAFEPYAARGIRVTEVYANHGVAVPIVLDGQWVDGGSRNAELISGRNTLIRGLVALDPDFTPRDIQARLTLGYSDGHEEVATRTFFIETDSVANDLDTNVYFIVPVELIEAGMTFQLELLETTDEWRDLPEPAQVAYPPEPSFLGVEGSDMAIKIVIVPVDHDLGGECPEAPEVTDEELQFLADQLYMHNPVQRIEIERRDPIAYTSGLSSFVPLLSFLADLRAQDGADPAAYYYGVVRPCDGGADGVGGQAISIPDFPTQGNAWTRVSMGRWYNSLASTANTFVHEIGHNQGRRHIACNGTEGGVNPSYPYPAGDIGVWGFGSLDFVLRPPNSAKDYMTYCGNTWVSDWGWSRVVPFIREITSWDAQGAPAPSESQTLVGLFDPATGDESWLVTPGDASGLITDGTTELELTSGDGLRTSLEAAVVPMGDDDAFAVVTELPAELTIEDQATLQWRYQGRMRQVDQLRVDGAVRPLRH